MNIYITSDTHFNHAKLHENWGRPKDFENKILKSFERLQPTDMLIHLGDICIGQDQDVHETLQSFHFCKVLVKGNHDRKSNNWYLEHGWNFVCDEFSLNTHGKRILFSHIPQMYDVEKYDLNIHGHLHDTHHRPEVKDFHGRKFKLISLEFSNYQTIKLENVLKGLDKPSTLV